MVGIHTVNKHTGCLWKSKSRSDKGSNYSQGNIQRKEPGSIRHQQSQKLGFQNP